jgi:large subunit ribosomal protein L31
MTIHPDTHLVEVTCAACGTVHALRTTAPSLSAEICSSCHPAYTGRERAVSRGSRVERFNRRLALAAA